MAINMIAKLGARYTLTLQNASLDNNAIITGILKGPLVSSNCVITFMSRHNPSVDNESFEWPLMPTKQIFVGTVQSKIGNNFNIMICVTDYTETEWTCIVMSSLIGPHACVFRGQ